MRVAEVPLDLPLHPPRRAVTYVHAFTLAFMAFFAIMNPVSAVPVFLGLTQGDDAETARAVARKALLTAFLIVAVFSVAGKMIFELFGITLPALRIAGGLLVALVGFHMVQGTPSAVQQPSGGDQASAREAALSVAVSPLAMPLLAGPGTIATAMNLSAHTDPLHLALTLTAFALLCAITYLLLLNGRALVRWIGPSGLNALTRIMGLILAVIGTQMVIAGVKGAFHLAG